MGTIAQPVGMIGTAADGDIDGSPRDRPEPPPLDQDALDREVILAALDDPDAFAPLYERYAPAIGGYCLRRLGDPEAAADATSLIFVRALQRLDTFRPGQASTVRSWLFAIAHNTVVDTHRRNVFRLHRTRSLDRPDRDDANARDRTSPVERLVAADRTTDPEDLAIAREAIVHVRNALARLPERQRQIVELRMAGLSGIEIASALDMTIGAVKSAQFRAFGTLRPLLDDSSRNALEADDAPHP